MSKFAKFYTAATGALLTFGAAVVKSTPASVTGSEWLMLAGGAVTAVAVYAVSN